MQKDRPKTHTEPAVFFFSFKLHGENLKEEVEKALTRQLPPKKIKELISIISELVQKSALIFPKNSKVTFRFFNLNKHIPN